MKNEILSEYVVFELFKWYESRVQSRPSSCRRSSVHKPNGEGLNHACHLAKRAKEAQLQQKSSLTCFLIWRKLWRWLFGGHCFREVFQTLHHYNLAWGLAIHTRFDDLDLISMSPFYHVHKLQFQKNVIQILFSCPLWFKRCMAALHIKKIKHSILCVTGVYLRDIIIMVIFKRLSLKVLSALQKHEGGGGTGKQSRKKTNMQMFLSSST